MKNDEKLWKKIKRKRWKSDKPNENGEEQWKMMKNYEKLWNIARGTTDPGYWVFNLNDLVD